MTKAKIEKEAEKYFKSICGDYNEEYERTGKRHYWVGFDIKNAYLAGAEPREKQIQIDAKQIRALQKQNGELTDKLTLTNNECKKMREELKQRIRENQKLEAQIEKMKRCEICKHYQCGSCNYHSNWVKDCKENGMKLFELKKIKEK